MDLKKIIQSIIQEGCIEETISAVETHLGAHTARVQSIKESLTQIATDETRHAQFAWETIRWILERFSEVEIFVTNTFRIEIENRIHTLEKSLLLESWDIAKNTNSSHCEKISLFVNSESKAEWVF